MSGLAERAGRAAVWRALDIGAVKTISIVRLLVLTRLIAPADFGLLSIGVTSIAFFGALTNFGTASALIQQGRVEDREYNIGWTVRIFRALLVAIIVFLLAPVIATAFGEPRSEPVLMVIAFLPVLDATASARTIQLRRTLRFRALTVIAVSQAVINTVVAIVFARAWGVWAVLAGLGTASVTGVMLSYVLAPHVPRVVIDLVVLRRLFNYGKWLFATSLIAVAADALIRAIISRRLGVEELGAYHVAGSIAFLPANVASEGIGSVAFPLYSRLLPDIEKIRRAFRTLLKAVLATLLPVSVVMMVLAPAIVEFAMGAQWSGNVTVMQVLIVAAILGLFGEICVPLFKGVGQPSRITAVELVQSATTVLLLLWLLADGELVDAAFAVLGGVAAAQFVSALFVRDLLAGPVRGLFRHSTAALVVAIACGAAARALVGFINGIVALAGAFIAAALVGVAVLWVLDRGLRLGMKQDLVRALPWLERPASVPLGNRPR